MNGFSEVFNLDIKRLLVVGSTVFA